ncbi:hypothetical protein [Rhizobium sp. NZLR4b]|uniref:hypothetical protein n=1 Tax=Rhizobium sp. NZLR4b TaxID=2731102 RepID=UPI001C82CB76|nr:hypothetical protein [Rhizobium sp. NZLR4b]MBX5164758.1 hypothetical protein [Rhizobium sp. NZLR4b]
MATKGSRIGLYGLTREELQEPGVAVRKCLNPVAPHLFVFDREIQSEVHQLQADADFSGCMISVIELNFSLDY